MIWRTTNQIFDHMKKALFTILAGAAVILAGCNKEADKTPEQKLGKTYSITATIENPATRSVASLNETTDKYDFSWEEGEMIGVVPDGYSTVLEFQLAEGSDDTFTYEAKGDDPEYKSFGLAVTPLDALQPESSVVSYDVVLGGSYTMGQSNAVMVAGTPVTQGDGTQKFSFKHLAALVRVTYENIPEGVLFMEFTTPDHPITGTYHFTAVSGAEIVAGGFPDGESMGQADVMLPEYTGTISSADFYLPIPTGNYSTFNVRLVDEGGETVPGSQKTFSTASPFTVARADVVECPKITLETTPVDPYVGSYIIVSKAATKDYWVVMKSGVDGNGRWAYDETTIAYTEDVDLTNSSTDFATYSNAAHKFAVEAFDGGYVLLDVATGKYIQYYTGNSGKEVEPSQRVKFSTFTFNNDGTVTIGMKNGSDTYSLQYNVGNYFSFYKSSQAPIYLIPYVGSATKASISSITCEDNVVTISSIPANAIIRYTLDGTDPTETSTLYTEPFTITETVTVKAKAFAPSSDYTDSDVETKECVWVNPAEHTYYRKVTSAQTDWSGEYLFVYEAESVAFKGSLTSLDVANNTISVTIENGKIEKTTSVSANAFTVAAVTGGYSIKSASGYYIGYSGTSNNGLTQNQNYNANLLNTISYSSNKVTIKGKGGKELAYNSASDQKRFRYLTTANIAVYKLEDKRAESNLAWSDETGSIVLTTENGAIKETKTLPSLTNPNSVDVTYSSSKDYIASIDENGVIAWKTAGETTIFADFGGNETYKPKTVSYTLTVTDERSQCASPSFNPVSGSVVALNSTVAITCATSGAKVYYTTDGSNPTEESTEYTAPLTVTGDMTIKAIAVNSPAYLNSDIVSASYTVQKVVDPVFSPTPGAVEANTEVTISCDTEGATIYYTTDGTTPTAGSTEYTGAITITSAVTIKAIAIKSGYLNSGVVEANYTIQGEGLAPNTVLFTENWGTANSSISGYTGAGASSYNDASTITYSTSNSSKVSISTQSAGNMEDANLFINGSKGQAGYTMYIGGIKTYGAKKVRVVFACNNAATTVGVVESSSAEKVSANSAANTADFVLTGNEDTITLKIYNNSASNTRTDNYQVIFIE